MRNIILTITFLLLSFISNSQTKYYSPNLYSKYLLDSLSIPYIPINLRVSGEGFSKSYQERFVKTFGNDIQFIPNHSDKDVSIDQFCLNKNFVLDKDRIFIEILSEFEFYVISKSIIPINDDLHKSIWVIEIYCEFEDSFDVILFYQNKDEKFETIFDNIQNIPIGSLSKINYQ